ncbi:DUF523 domain-containing protein [Lujinxingia litoralis]|uniref:DUF523 domain-containing protein n=1 Tax=Lujinxingia litoralis TaxID=2211119 RepID=A0A328C5R7_9DELT|nr:DUF523 domain-containing protein [Lujinxingia litoralis]RAL22356.1 DUF523 domain-containing protein [Lujinxingia litoralis]
MNDQNRSRGPVVGTSNKVLVSACLLGREVRYDGKDSPVKSASGLQWLAAMHRAQRLVAVCPEVGGGLSVPRPPAELVGGDGLAFWRGQARVISVEGLDVSAEFERGACLALELARRHQVCAAVLKARSPSCGGASVYDGSFEGRLIPGQGVTAALLRWAGVAVFTDEELDQARAFVEARG